MASGCIVVGHLTEHVRDEVRAQSGLDVPIIEATPVTLESVLRDLASDPDLDGRRASMIEFVGVLHDGRQSARALIERWIELEPHDQKEPTRASRD
jgi:hypothetical protein